MLKSLKTQRPKQMTTENVEDRSRGFTRITELDAITTKIKAERKLEKHQWEPPEAIPDKLRRCMPNIASLPEMLDTVFPKDEGGWQPKQLEHAIGAYNCHRKVLFHRWKLGFYDFFPEWLDRNEGHGVEFMPWDAYYDRK